MDDCQLVRKAGINLKSWPELLQRGKRMSKQQLHLEPCDPLQIPLIRLPITKSVAGLTGQESTNSAQEEGSPAHHLGSTHSFSKPMTEQSSADTQVTDAHTGRGRLRGDVDISDALVLRQRGVKPKRFIYKKFHRRWNRSTLRFHNGRRTRPEEETEVKKGDCENKPHLGGSSSTGSCHQNC